MNIIERIGQLLAGRKLPAPERDTVPDRLSTAPREVVNDAQSYGVAIAAATVAPGRPYWQAVRIHHLTPEENGGNHNIYIDILDPALGDGSNPNGGRVNGARTRVTWDGGEQIITVDKPANEPGTNFPMWKWQVCAAQVLGLPGQELPSDRVTGLHTGHPDEASGNTLFHHSFHITFVKVQIPLPVERSSVVYGLVHNGAGRTVRLLAGEQIAGEQLVNRDDTFRFTELAAGQYVVEVAGTGLRSEPVSLDGSNRVQLDLTLTLAQSVVRGYVRNGVGYTVTLTRNGAPVATQVVASDETYYFSGLTAGEYRVAVDGTSAAAGPLTLDGTNAVDLDLIVAALDKTLDHYVLFGPAGCPATEANVLLALDYILAFRPSFGFNSDEAAAAGLVTIIAGVDAVSGEIQAQLAADGTVVQRIAGPVEAVARVLADRVAAGKAFA
jgi:hypothetical protein